MTWKPLIIKWKNWTGSFILQKKPSRPAIIQNMSYVFKKNVKYDKNQKLIYFFCEEPVSRLVKS